MKRTNHISTLLIAALALLPGVYCPLARAQNAPPAPAAANAVGPLPVRSVTLFSSGVAFTMREGDVDGDATIPLSFRTAQMNDILKSLVLLDDKGTVQPVVYGAKDPISRTLQSFAVDVTQPMSRADLLNRMRGQTVTVTTGGATKTATITGQIIGVESKVIVLDANRTTTVETLNLLGDAGMQAVRLDDVETIKFADEKINREFRDALSLLASGADDRRRQVTLRFTGNSRRRVRVGYIAEAPLWKISYRLLVSDSDEKPYMQGWAMVENTSDEDWNNVRLSLVSGRPISFIQDLYQPLYLPRPIVPPDIVASPYPQIAEGAMGNDKDAENLAVAPPAPVADMAANKPVASARANRAGGGRGGFGGGGFGAVAPGGGVTGMAEANGPVEAKVDAGALGTMAAQATGEKAGELFQYNITTPVTLPRQQAAMIPVLAQNIDGQKVSLYNADSGSKYPLNAFRIKNSSSLHLKGGPVTVFDAGVYAGDARMEDIPPGDTRLITYAVDLAMEGERQGGNTTIVQTSVSIKRGVMTTSRRERYETKYVLKNKAAKPRTVLVEHPFRQEFTLVQPKQATERTPSHYRFEVTVPAMKSGTLSVIEERPVAETFALLNGDLNFIEYRITQAETPEKVKAALREVLSRRRKMMDIQSQIGTAEAEIKAIDEDQDRIRKNMGPLDRNSALYKRYVTQLDEQETRMQNLRQTVTRLKQSLADADRDFRAYLDSLDL